MGAMGLASAAGTVAGLGFGIAGTAMSASAANKRRKSLAGVYDRWLPDIDQYTDRYFADLLKFSPQAERLATDVAMSDLERATAIREKQLPGFTEGTQSAFQSLLPLLRGELPQSVLEAFQSAGGASSVGLGFGGSQFGALNQGLFGARGALGAMQTGYGLLPALLSSLPNINSPSTAAFLESIMTPAQRTQTQLSVRAQNIGVAQQIAGMPTGKDVWGGFLQETGGMLAGAGVSGMGQGFGGGGSSLSSSGMSAGGLSGGGAAGGFGGASWSSAMA